MSLPPVRLPFISSKLRFSPLLTWWIADRQTHLHALRLGPAVLVGFPGDYSGHLADRLDASTRGSGLSNIATSFDGDFRGYLVSENVFHRKSCYETRWMSFYGPWTGEYFNDLARRMVLRLSNETIYSPWPAPTWMDLVARLALGLLLGSAVLVVWQERWEVGVILARSGVFTVGIAAAAVLVFEADPNLFDWAKFGLPWWLRLVGFPLGIVALSVALAIPERPGKTALLFGVSCALLSANWLVVLMTLRGWIKSSLGIPANQENRFDPRTVASIPQDNGFVPAS